MKKSLRAYRKAIDLPLSRLLRGLIGLLLIPMLPGYSASIRTTPFRQHLSRVGRLIRNGYLVRAVGEKDHDLIRRFLADYWSSQASDEFYTELSHRYETLFLTYHSRIVEETLKVISGSERLFPQLVEIGAGDGKILSHFSRHLPGVSAFHGVDINKEQVEKNRQIYGSDSRLEFHHRDASEWLAEHVVPGTILVANGGVLEYFTRPELESIFARLAENAPCMVALTESIAADHDLDRDPKTHPYGFELSLSHNYLAILKEAGFSIDYVNDRLTTPVESEIVGRWLQIVAHLA
jgi:hypothetical protein